MFYAHSKLLMAYVKSNLASPAYAEPGTSLRRLMLLVHRQGLVTAQADGAPAGRASWKATGTYLGHTTILCRPVCPSGDKVS